MKNIRSYGGYFVTEKNKNTGTSQPILVNNTSDVTLRESYNKDRVLHEQIIYSQRMLLSTRQLVKFFPGFDISILFHCRNQYIIRKGNMYNQESD